MSFHAVHVLAIFDFRADAYCNYHVPDHPEKKPKAHVLAG